MIGLGTEGDHDHKNNTIQNYKIKGSQEHN